MKKCNARLYFHYDFIDILFFSWNSLAGYNIRTEQEIIPSVSEYK